MARKSCLTILLSLAIITYFGRAVPSQEKHCPTITLECVSKDCCRSPFRFVAHVRNAPSKRLSYKWTTSAGKIIKGQGTPAITVVSQPSEMVIATLEVFGADVDCPRLASITTMCDPPPPVRLFDEYSVVSGFSDKAHLDRFIAQLQKEPGAQGYIVTYGDRSRGETSKSYLVTNGNIEPDRLVVVHRKRRSNKPTIKLYLVPTGANPPRY